MGICRAVLSLLLFMMLNPVNSQNYTHHMKLDDAGKYRLSWNLPEDERGDSIISFRVVLQAKGCFGLGFSPDGRFPGCDIVGGWVKDDGKVFFKDLHGDASGMLIVDEQQDYELLNAYENETSTVFEFSRKLDTCDTKDIVIDQSTMRVMFLLSKKDPADDIFDTPFDPYGDITGVRSVVLLDYKPMEGLDLSSLLQWNLKAPEIDISGKEAYIFCKIVKSPQVSEKHHVVYVQPQIQEEHEEFVYHMGIHQCNGTPEDFDDLLDARGFECYTPDFPPQLFKCQAPYYAWSAGGGDFPLPKDAGFPIHSAPGDYYMFEINYENRQRKTGIIDSSGFTLYYTPEVRKYDAGHYALCASMLPRVFIPPRQDKYVVAAHTTPNCVSSRFPETGVKCSAILLHARSMGQSITVRHFRGNEELVPLIKDNNYDAYYQPFRYPREERVILPNDQLTIECTYNSSNRSDATLSGMTTVDEICAAVFMIYPKMDRYYSFSAATFASINRVLNTNITNEEEAARILKDYNWSTVDTGEVQNVTRYSEHETQCYFGPFRDDIDHPLVSYPADLVPYEPPSTCSATT